MESLSNIILTPSEIDITFEILEIFIHEGQLKEAWKVLKSLENSIYDSIYERAIEGNFKTLLLFFTSALYFKEGNFEKSLLYCKDSIKNALSTYGDESYIADMLLLSFHCMVNLGGDSLKSASINAYFANAAICNIKACENIIEYNIGFETYDFHNIISNTFFEEYTYKKVPFDAASSFLSNIANLESVTATELSSGICSGSTLNRFFNCTILEVDILTLEAVTQRLGFDMLIFQNHFISKKEFEVISIKDKIEYSLLQNNFDEAERVLETFKQDSFLKKAINKQFSLKIEYLILSNKGQKDLGILMEALKLTIPKFKEEMLRSTRLTHQEINIIKEIAMFFCDVDYHRGVEIFEGLIRSIERYYNEGKAKDLLLIPVFDSYCESLNMGGQYQKSLEKNSYLETKILKSRKITSLSKCFKHKVFALERLGFNEKASTYYNIALTLESVLKL